MPAALTVRHMMPDDIPACARWVAETELWQRYGVTEAGMRERLTTALANGATIHVAEEASAVVGFIWVVARGAFDRSGYIQLVGVQPDQRGRGVGRALMEFAETQLFAHTRAIFLLVSDFNLDAQRFYQRRGYRQVGALEDYVVRGVSELIFWKRREEQH